MTQANKSRQPTPIRRLVEMLRPRLGVAALYRWARNKKSFVKISIIMLLAPCGLAAADSKELEPLPLEEAKAIAVKFDSLRPGMSPEQVGSALGLETVTERIITYEGMVSYAGSSDPRHVRVCVMRDGYAFTLNYVESATNGLALSEWLWRPDLDWPKGTSNPNQSLASIGNPFQGTQSIRLSGFAVDVKTNSFMPVAANIWIKAGRLDDVKKRQADVEKCIRSRLAGLTTKDLAKARVTTAIQLDIRSALNSAIPGHPIRYVDLVFDVQ